MNSIANRTRFPFCPPARRASLPALATILTLLLTGFADEPPAVRPDPPWHLPSFSRRMVFAPGALRSAPILVRLPEGVDFDAERDRPTAVDDGGRLRSASILPGTEGTVLLRVDVAGSGEGLHAVYFRPDPDAADTAVPEAQPEGDRLPFRVELFRLRVDTVPNTKDRLRFMIAQAAAAPDLRAAGPEIAVEFPRRGRAGRNTGHAARIRSFLHVTETGTYRFALAAPYPAWLSVAGMPATETSPRTPEGEPSGPGPALHLEAGVHTVELCAAVHTDGPVSLHWIPPGGQEPVPLPPDRLVAPEESPQVRWERRDRTLHADFTIEHRRMYRFRNHPAVFHEVQLRDATVNWVTPRVTRTWTRARADKPFSDGEAPVHVFSGPGPHRVRLRVRDELGFVSVIERGMDPPDAVPEVFDLHADLVGVAPVLYPDEYVHPRLSLTARMPADIPVDVTWTRIRADGSREDSRQELRLQDHTIEIPLGSGPAEEMDRLQWSVAHAGTLLARGECRFLRPPFASVPARIEGEALFDDGGRRLVLLPHRIRGRYRQPPILIEQAFGHILCVDDALLQPGTLPIPDRLRFDRELARIVDGPDLPIVRSEAAAAWTRVPHAYGALAELKEIGRRLDAEPTDVVVLSLGLRDLAAGVDPGCFERRAAALSDLVSETRGIPVLWVTPPPYSAEPEALRAIAQAIRRVADARDMPVADLFTAFMGVPPDDPPTVHPDRMELTEHGHARAAYLIARALLARAGERRPQP